MADQNRTDPSRGIPDKAPKEKSVHTQKIAAERAIMEMTGANRSQIRNAALGSPLRDFITRMQGGGGVVQQQAPAPPAPPQIETTEQSFQPQPLTLGLVGGLAAPNAPQNLGIPVTVSGCLNGSPAVGVAYYQSAPEPF